MRVNLRKVLGGALIRLGRRIARPTVTVEPLRFADVADVNALISEQIRMSRMYAQDTRLPRLRLHGMDGTAWGITGAGGGGGGIYLPPDDGPAPVSC